MGEKYDCRSRRGEATVTSQRRSLKPAAGMMIARHDSGVAGYVADAERRCVPRGIDEETVNYASTDADRRRLLFSLRPRRRRMD